MNYEYIAAVALIVFNIAIYVYSYSVYRVTNFSKAVSFSEFYLTIIKSQLKAAENVKFYWARRLDILVVLPALLLFGWYVVAAVTAVIIALSLLVQHKAKSFVIPTGFVLTR